MAPLTPHSFFTPAGVVDVDGRSYEVFDPTEFAASVWANTMQHGAPPAALLVRAIEGLVSPGTAVSRVVIDLLGVVPMTRSRVRAWVARPGRSIAMVAAEMDCEQTDGSFRTVARAHAWALAISDTVAVAQDHSPTMPPRDSPATPMPEFFVQLQHEGFLGACEWRFVESPADGGRNCWIRPSVPLVAGEQSSPLVQIFSVIDAANGISAYLDYRTSTWMNMGMTVHLRRTPNPVDGWIGVTADQFVGPEGIGTTQSRIYDDAGAFAVGAQTLLVARR